MKLFCKDQEGGWVTHSCFTLHCMSSFFNLLKTCEPGIPTPPILQKTGNPILCKSVNQQQQESETEDNFPGVIQTEKI